MLHHFVKCLFPAPFPLRRPFGKSAFAFPSFFFHFLISKTFANELMDRVSPFFFSFPHLQSLCFEPTHLQSNNISEKDLRKSRVIFRGFKKPVFCFLLEKEAEVRLRSIKKTACTEKKLLFIQTFQKYEGYNYRIYYI